MYWKETIIGEECGEGGGDIHCRLRKKQEIEGEQDVGTPKRQIKTLNTR